ncbi:MAG: (deoxy)nucleoside triphosphate pyrophosphohydrolase [Bacteroidia bacterium]|nr:(deoxy)nucleoside triphosphate pyrophosphohydrolase [Bacteroidia bacterium]
MIDVSCGIIEREGKVLAARKASHKPYAGKWEFPGGKLDPFETAESALIREIFEELAIQIRIVQRLPEVVHAYPYKVVRLYPIICQWVSGEPVYTDHDKIVWLDPEQLVDLDWMEADLPILDMYLRGR